MIIRGRYVLAGDGRVIENGAVQVEGDCIADVGTAGEVASGTTEDLGDCLILPGFVNTHTHLELSHLANRVPPAGDFVDWLSRLVEAMIASRDDPTTIQESVRSGRDQSLAAGVTTVGDITRLPNLTRPVLADGPLRVVSFGEVIAVGRLRDRLQKRVAAAIDPTHHSPWLEIGLSPHAPYSLEPDGLRICVAEASQRGLRLCMHLAETPEETVFTQRRTGPLVEHYRRWGFWDDQVPCHQQTPVDCAWTAGILGPNTVLAHVNYVTDSEIDRLATTGVHVAYCPRTHAAFGHSPHAFRRMLERGLNVCIGTDSLASNPSLSVLGELRLLREHHPGLASGLLFEMGASRGARALGFQDRLGALGPGMQADLVSIPLEAGGPSDPLENVLRSSSEPGEVWVAGRQVYPPQR